MSTPATAHTSRLFRKRPVQVEAAQWYQNGDHPLDGVGETVEDPVSKELYPRIEGHVVGFFRHPEVPGDHSCQHCALTMHVHGWIDTLEGGHVVCPGDWIVTGVEGERYPVKPSIFELTYEPVTG